MAGVHRYNTNVASVDVGNRPTSSSAGERWQSATIYFHNFLRDINGGHYLFPKFKCNNRHWKMVAACSDDGEHIMFVPLYLSAETENTATTYEFKIIDKFGVVRRKEQFSHQFRAIRSLNDIDGIANDTPFLHVRPDILRRFLDNNGTLAVVMSIKEVEEEEFFVPTNPMSDVIRKKFTDKETADVYFEIYSAIGKEGGTKRAKKLLGVRHAHSFILKTCAPMLAALCGTTTDGEVTTVAINDVKPKVFAYMLYYVYGGTVPATFLKEHARDFTDAADKYSIVNLKLEAEAAYVNSTTITIENAMDNLLYADAKNCALLKETVMDFLTENSNEASQKISFTDFPGHIVKDLLVAFTRKNKDGSTDENDGDNFSGLRVNELRRQLHEKGLDVDGSREAMIDALKTYAEREENNAAKG